MWDLLNLSVPGTVRMNNGEACLCSVPHQHRGGGVADLHSFTGFPGRMTKTGGKNEII